MYIFLYFLVFFFKRDNIKTTVNKRVLDIFQESWISVSSHRQPLWITSCTRVWESETFGLYSVNTQTGEWHVKRGSWWREKASLTCLELHVKVPAWNCLPRPDSVADTQIVSPPLAPVSPLFLILAPKSQFDSLLHFSQNKVCIPARSDLDARLCW